MNEIKPTRPFQERLLEGFERSRLRQEVLKAKRGRLDSMRRRYGTMVLGASLAVGGLGVPLRSGSGIEQNAGHTVGKPPAPIVEALSEDILAAQRIAREVTGGVTAAAHGIAAPVLQPGVQATKSAEAFNVMSEKLKEEFFKKEVPFGSIIYKEAKRNDLQPELVAAVVQTESRFIPTARSGAGAVGLMQLVPRTGKWMGAKNLTDPADNVKAGTKYLKYLNEQFDGDQKKVIAAYNAGEGNVRRFGGVPPFKETRNYLKKVAAAEQEFKDKVSGTIAERVEAIPAGAPGGITR